MTTKFIFRFAPSPTGRLHLGHAWSAVTAFDDARAAGGRFVLRIEDIDSGRCRAEFVDAIYEDLRWLGLDWDGDVMFQSRRGDIYADALGRLDEIGLVYRCTCTRAEIAESASAPQGPMGALYPGTCRSMGIGESDRPYCWRLNVAKAMALTGPLTWNDTSAGTVSAQPALLGDVVVARKDVLSSYHLAVTVDDAAQEVTHIIRGRDLFEATHIHRLLQALLGLPAPIYQHHPLIFGADGNRLAKRSSALSLASLRASGMEGRALADQLRNGHLPFGFALQEG